VDIKISHTNMSDFIEEYIQLNIKKTGMLHILYIFFVILKIDIFFSKLLCL